MRRLKSASAAWCGAALGALVGWSGPAAAYPQTDVVTPTGWWWISDAPVETIEERVREGFRIVDIEVEDDAPLRMSAAFVADEGDYDKAWWWYFGQTAAEVDARIDQHKARLIDVEPYLTAEGMRYAIVLIANAGTDFASDHGWHAALTGQQLQDWIDNPRGNRIIDIQPYRDGDGQLRYAIVWVENSGFLISAWWVYFNVSTDFVGERLKDFDARLIDLEPHDESVDTVSCVLVPADGQAWWWFFGLRYADIEKFADQHAARITDFQRYGSGDAERFALILRRNANDLTVNVNNGMLGILPLSACSGFLSREFDGGTYAAVNRDRVFEPASLMKTVYHFHAMLQVALGNDLLGATLSIVQGAATDCPDPTNPTYNNSLQQALTDMMQQSHNPKTEAVRARYGNAAIEGTAALFGAMNTRINHVIGCFCGQTRNELTLDDLYEVHDGAHDGALGSFRDEFYDFMSNGLEFGMGVSATLPVLNAELAASSLSPADQNEFRGGIFVATKGGSYSCTFGDESERHRSRGGYILLPFKEGCSTVEREFFIGAWVNDADVTADAEDAVGLAISELWRDRVRAAIQSWEDAECDCPSDLNGDGMQNVEDVELFVQRFLDADPDNADVDQDGDEDVDDVELFIQNFLAGCSG